MMWIVILSILIIGFVLFLSVGDNTGLVLNVINTFVTFSKSDSVKSVEELFNKYWAAKNREALENAKLNEKNYLEVIKLYEEKINAIKELVDSYEKITHILPEKLSYFLIGLNVLFIITTVVIYKFNAYFSNTLIGKYFVVSYGFDKYKNMLDKNFLAQEKLLNELLDKLKVNEPINLDGYKLTECESNNIELGYIDMKPLYKKQFMNLKFIFLNSLKLKLELELKWFFEGNQRLHILVCGYLETYLSVANIYGPVDSGILSRIHLNKKSIDASTKLINDTITQYSNFVDKAYKEECSTVESRDFLYAVIDESILGYEYPKLIDEYPKLIV